MLIYLYLSNAVSTPFALNKSFAMMIDITKSETLAASCTASAPPKHNSIHSLNAQTLFNLSTGRLFGFLSYPNAPIFFLCLHPVF